MTEAIAGGSLFVAALAVAATIVTTVMTGRTQRGLAREQYLIKQRTRTYIDIVAATGKYEGGIGQALYRNSGRLSARMEVYASHDAHKAWTKYVVASGMYEKLMKTNDRAPPVTSRSWKPPRTCSSASSGTISVRLVPSSLATPSA